MTTLSTTRMSSKGQVVVPEAIRSRLGLEPGTQFVVVADNDAIILKEVEAPSMGKFDDLLNEARRQVRKIGLKRSDIADVIAETRHRR